MKITFTNKDAYQLFHDGILALSRAEQHGFRVDVEYIENKKLHLTRRIDRMERQFKNTKFYKHWEHSQKSAVNIHSNIQLRHFLYDVKHIKPEKETVTGQGATDEEALSALGIPEMEALLEIRKLKKIRDTYLDAFHREQVNGTIHPVYNLHLVRTLRSSSDSPNFQNIPKRDEEAMRICRKALYPHEGHQLLEIDFSGAEVKVAACYHKDPTMLKYINDPHSDMHSDMAAQLFEIDKFDKKTPGHGILRQAAKNGFVFPQFYGDYYGNCAGNLACNWGGLPRGAWHTGQGIEVMEGVHLADHLIKKGYKNIEAFTQHVRDVENDFWGKRFLQYSRWKDEWWGKYQKTGYIDLLTGFRCSGLMNKKETINYPVQGAAFHCLLWCFIEMDKYLHDEQMNSRLIGQIHDSMILDADPAEVTKVIARANEIISVELPAAWPWIIVPMEADAEICDVDCSWADKHKYEP